MAIEINDAEKDILREILNIGVARAADSFATIVHERVLLTVPHIKILQLFQVQHIKQGFKDNDTLIQSKISGDLTGKTFLLLRQEQVEQIAERCLKDHNTASGANNGLQDSLLMEISNILTGAVLTQIADIMGFEIMGSPPEAPTKNVMEGIKTIVLDFPVNQPLVLTVNTSFLSERSVLEFPLILVFNTESFEKMVRKVRTGKDHILIRKNKLI
ncbi:MAG: chemotaxis protein CheC [Bacteroidia bacterium]